MILLYNNIRIGSYYDDIKGFPRWLSGWRIRLQCRKHRRCGFNPWVGKVPWRRVWQTTPVFLPGESHGQRSLVGYSLWGREESDTTATEHAHVHADIKTMERRKKMLNSLPDFFRKQERLNYSLGAFLPKMSFLLSFLPPFLFSSLFLSFFLFFFSASEYKFSMA